MTAELKDGATVSPEISKYLSILSKDPGSMVFAPLAEAYRKAGMLDEAIATAREGMKLRPDYVSGMVALGRACFEKGLLAEARENLQKVLQIAPDNIIAAGILEEIKRQGPEQPEPAISNLEPVKAFSQEPEASSQKIEEPAIEELTELEELAEVVEEEAEEDLGDFQVEEIAFEAPEPGLGLAKEAIETEEEKTAEVAGVWGEETASLLEEEGPDLTEAPGPEAVPVKLRGEEKEARPRKEITTETIADLYIKQGYLDKAIDVYQTLYDADPGNDDIKTKLDELKMRGAGGSTLKGIMGQATEIREPEPVAAKDESIENIDRLESWLKTIQNERRKV